MQLSAPFPLFRPAIYALIAVGLVFQLAEHFHLFFTLSWFDMIMHFLGGFFIAISVLSLMTRKGGTFSYGQILFWGIAGALTVGLLWECFELYFGITYWYSPDYWGDNGMDVTMDTLGGLIAVWYAYYKLNKIRKLTHTI